MTDWRVIPLHITSFIKGLAWPSKWHGQRSSTQPPPQVTHPETPIPKCPTPSLSLLTQGEITLSRGNTAPLRVLQKRVKFKKWSLLSAWGCKGEDDRSMQGTRSLDWHLHKLFILIVRANLLRKDLHEKYPRSTPHWDQSLLLCLPLFLVCFRHKKHFSRTAYKACLQLKTNNIVQLPAVGNGLQAAADVLFGNKHLPGNLKSLLPSDITPLILKLLEKLVDAFVGVHVFLPRRDEKEANSKQWS